MIIFVWPDTTAHCLNSLLFPVKQWAAVTTQRGDTSEPPHVCWPDRCRLTCHGQWSMDVSVPPTMRCSGPTFPQSEQDKDTTDPELHTLRSAVACCIGVFEVPGLTAVNGPVFIGDIKELTKMFLLVGFIVYPSCVHAVCVCAWVQSSAQTVRQPESGL